MAGQQDLWPWLQSIMANQGAGQPNSIAGMPRYGTGPGNLGMGDPRGLTAPTPGQPSMGYPAMGQPGAQPPPAPQPPAPDALGSSVTVASNGSAGNDGGFNNPYQAAANSFFPGAALGQGGIGSDARFAPPSAPFVQPQHPSTMRYSGWPTPVAPAAPAGSLSATPPGKGPLASPAAAAAAPMKRTPGAPNLGYYNPTPRFSTFQYNVPGSGGGQGGRSAPIYTALNLGGGGPPAANPANVPAAGAQPVSASAPNAYPGDAGWNVDAQGNPIPDSGDLQNWNYGPLQQGNIWRGSGGPSGRINR